MIYDVDYFIAKFEAIPEDKWTDTGDLIDHEGRCCALGLLGVKPEHLSSNLDEIQHPEGSSLAKLLSLVSCDQSEYAIVYKINDNNRVKYCQPTPKQRILAALYDIKAMQKLELKPFETELAEQLL